MMDSELSSIDLEYSPSHWSTRYPKELVVPMHIETVTQASNKVRDTIPYETVSYGPEETSKVDIFGTTLPKDAPIFVYIHGGLWQELNKDISSYPVIPLVKSGIRVLIPGYSLAPAAKLGEIVDQIKRLGEYVFKTAAKSGVRAIWYGGHSAGAHLAASLLDKRWINKFEKSTQLMLKGLVLISGVFDLVPIVQTYVNKALKLDVNEAQCLSPINKGAAWISRMNPEFLVVLVITENDSPSFRTQTLEYEKHLIAEDINTKLFYLNAKDHYDVVEDLQNETDYLTMSIIELLSKKY